MSEPSSELIQELLPYWTHPASWTCQVYDLATAVELGYQQHRGGWPTLQAKDCLVPRTPSKIFTTQRLITKAEDWGVRVILCDESYTSRTCGACGLLGQSSQARLLNVRIATLSLTETSTPHVISYCVHSLIQSLTFQMSHVIHLVSPLFHLSVRWC